MSETKSDGGRTRVMIVDDHPLWLEALSAELTSGGFEVVAVAKTGTECLQRARASRPDMLVTNLTMPEPSGQACIETLHAEFPEMGILVVSGSSDREHVLSALRAGALGYVLKTATGPELIQAARLVANGSAMLSQELSGWVMGEFRRLVNETDEEEAAPTLTGREVEVLQQVARGKAYRDIAADLFISHRTVQNHVHNVLRKLGLTNRVELTLYAIEQGLLRPDEVF
ncbi:response regulator [Tessaracoccus caeni]|uniref:response regulator n=1 Tax=Tessaracoccus caeni TaxID=3031239 RepID=UPI0023DABD3D|nr:response regulator transcription factor [Tessaracoccus caeni]MDF1486837.1 response regulator transcription factor [Tessaracoccus caeni]